LALLTRLALLLAGLLARLRLLRVLLLLLLVVLRAHILVVRHDAIFLVKKVVPARPMPSTRFPQSRSEETRQACSLVPLLQKAGLRARNKAPPSLQK
jgi:hypothetical protein